MSCFHLGLRQTLSALIARMSTAIKHESPLRIECLKPLYAMRTANNYRRKPKLFKLSRLRLRRAQQLCTPTPLTSGPQVHLNTTNIQRNGDSHKSLALRAQVSGKCCNHREGDERSAKRKERCRGKGGRGQRDGQIEARPELGVWFLAPMRHKTPLVLARLPLSKERMRAIE